jgi:hypothetical protein
VVDTTTIRSVETSGDGTCEDNKRPYARMREDNGKLRACWTFHDDPVGSVDRIHCTEEDPVGTFSDVPLDPVVMGHNEHASVALVSGDRWVVHRGSDGSDFSIRLRFPDDTNDPEVVLATGPVNHPQIVESTNGTVYVVYSSGNLDRATIQQRWCTPSLADCADVNGWQGPERVAAGRSVSNPNMITDGDLQMVTFMQDGAPSGDPRWRARYVERCGTTAWSGSTPQSLRSTTANVDQVWFHGHLQMAADRLDDNIVHVTFLEAVNFDLQSEIPDSGSVFWARRTYTDCP